MTSPPYHACPPACKAAPAYLYERPVSDPQRFIAELQQATQPRSDRATEAVAFPREFLAYVQGIARPVLSAQLEPYITSIEATRSADPALLEAQGVVSGLLQRTRDVTPGSDLVEVISEFHGAIEQLNSLVGRSKGRGKDLPQLVDRLEAELAGLSPDMPADVLESCGRIALAQSSGDG